MEKACRVKGSLGWVRGLWLAQGFRRRAYGCAGSRGVEGFAGSSWEHNGAFLGLFKETGWALRRFRGRQTIGAGWDGGDARLCRHAR